MSFYYPQAPSRPPSTRMLTVTKWLTFGVSVLLTGLAVLWVEQLQHNVDFLEHYDGLAADASGDGKGLKGGDGAIARAETNVVIGYVTLVAVALLGVSALLAGLGQQWARVLCVLLLLGPMGVVVYGVADGGPEALYALVFLVPFGALLVLWCLPGVSRGLANKKLNRKGNRHELVHPGGTPAGGHDWRGGGAGRRGL